MSQDDRIKHIEDKLQDIIKDSRYPLPREDELSKRIDAIFQKFKNRLSNYEKLSTDAQPEEDLAARLINILPYLQRLKNGRVNVGQAELAADALLAQHPQLEFANKIIAGLEGRRDIYRSTFRSVWEGRSQVSQLLLGVAANVLLLTTALALLLMLTRRGLLGDFDPITGWVLLGGALGGISSLLVRLHDFAVMARWSPEADPKVLFFTGLLKPVVGMVLALFVWAAFSSGLLSLNLSVAASNPRLLYFALSFVAGFSERFAPDFANRATRFEATMMKDEPEENDRQMSNSSMRVGPI